jgi:hypothetical protein
MAAMPSKIARRRGVSTFVASLLAVPTPAAFGADVLDDAVAVDDSQLAEIRGGFETNGLNISFAVDRAVMVNGQVVAVQRLVIDRVADLLGGKSPSVQIVGDPITIIQNGPGNVAPTLAALEKTLPSPAQVTASASAANGAINQTLSQVQTALGAAQQALGAVPGQAAATSSASATSATAPVAQSTSGAMGGMGGMAGTGVPQPPAAMVNATPGALGTAIAPPASAVAGTAGASPAATLGNLPSGAAISSAVNNQVQAALAAAQASLKGAEAGPAGSVGNPIQGMASAAVANALQAAASQIAGAAATSGAPATIANQGGLGGITPVAPVVTAPATPSIATPTAPTITPPAIPTITPPTPPTIAPPTAPSITPPTIAQPTITSPSAVATAASTSAAAGAGALTGSTPAAPSTSPLMSTVVVQTGVPGQPVVLNNVPNGAAIATAVQNSLNNQLLQVQTQITAQLNALEVARSGALAAALRQQALDAVRR